MDQPQMFPANRRKLQLGASFEPVSGVSVVAEPGRRFRVAGIELCNDDPLRLAQTLIDAYMWAANQTWEPRSWEPR